MPNFFNYHKYLEASFKTKVHPDEFFRSNSCEILFNQNFSSSCSACHSHCIKLTSEANRKKSNLDQPSKLYHSCQVSRIQLETPAFDSVYKQ